MKFGPHSHHQRSPCRPVGKLDPDLAKAFPTSEAVNQALTGLLALTEQTARITGRNKRPAARKRAAV